MNVGSLFSGIGGLDHGLARAGFRHVFLCESDPWRRTVLAYHFPGVPIYEDVRDVGLEDGRRSPGYDEAYARRASATTSSGRDELDLLCGGFPCQDVSVAGRRAGLAGARSGLFYEFARIAESLQPRWLLVENVPGLLSSQGGRDFGAVLGTLADIGYGVAWRIVDSRYFGVPQRRRRVFIVGTLADGDPRGAAECAGQVLAVGTRCERHPAAGTEARKDVAIASISGLGSGGPDDNDGYNGRLVSVHENLSGSVTAADHARALRKGASNSYQFVAAPLSHGSNPNSNMAGRRREDDENLVTAFYPTGGSKDGFWQEDISPPMKVGTGVGAPVGIGVSSIAAGVRRLTPRECERLQALPDDWTAHGPDSRRYAALGDAVTSSVAEWIGRRLMEAA